MEISLIGFLLSIVASIIAGIILGWLGFNKYQKTYKNKSKIDKNNGIVNLGELNIYMDPNKTPNEISRTAESFDQKTKINN